MIVRTFLEIFNKRMNYINIFKLPKYSCLISNIIDEKFKFNTKYNSNLNNIILGIAMGTFFIYVNQDHILLPKFQLSAACSSKEYTKEEVSKHKSKETGIWVTYKDKVYDITQFVDQHPGGDKIYLAAGGALEPFWSIYAVHKENEEVMKILKEYEIGSLVHDANDEKALNPDDPFKNDPSRHPALVIINNQPFNAETPPELLIDKFLTPNPLFFIRNHLPVPVIQIEKFRLFIEGIGVTDTGIKFTLDEIKQFEPVTKIDSTIMCAGNRRKDMSTFKEVKGLSWTQGAISTARWTGVKLTDIFDAQCLSYERLVAMGAKYVQFVGLDTDITGSKYGASIPIEIALDPNAEVLLAYEMNDQEIPLDHGYPLRVIIPGVIGARQVKWLTKIIISDKESDSFWQQHDYKTFAPNIGFDHIDYSSVPPVTEPNVQSAICVPRDGQRIRNEGSVTVKGYAWSGGGRGIIRVEVSPDGGNTWLSATISDSKEVPTSSHINRKQWSWVLWEIEVPVEDDQKELEILCKAVDSSQNTQPESYKGTWNVRGLMSNAWHKVKVVLYND